ncbi:hypothetical protein [Paraburkholderia youngii]|uniref:hypothetical protein n=1 Tax=Paraburkholderia youngii TaxID=2782701 RepID=UPI003D20854F
MNYRLPTPFTELLITFSVVLCCASARASDIECNATQQPAERVICDHAILDNEYDDIYEQQQKLLSSGKVTSDLIANWTAERNACTDVHCVDGVFSKWKSLVLAVEAGQTVANVEQTADSHISTAPETNAPGAESNAAMAVEPQATASAPENSLQQASGHDAVSVPPTTSGHSTFDAVMGFVVICTLILIPVALYRFAASFANRCDSCGKRGAGKLTKKKVVDRRTETEIRTEKERTYDPQTNQVKSIREKKIPVLVTKTTYRKHYQCKFCKNCWTVLSEG